MDSGCKSQLRRCVYFFKHGTLLPSTFYFYFYLLLFQTRNTPIFYLGPTFNLSSGSKLGLSEYHLCPQRPGFEPEETAVIVVNSPTGLGLPFIWQIFGSERTYFRKLLCVISSGICPTK